MQRKLNQEFIKGYSEEFSEKITSAYFSQNTVIGGKEILSFSPSKQVNLLVLKILFKKWQEEMKHIESPYFDYKNTDVRKAMVQFMNVVSQHIQVDAAHILPLLSEAVEEAIQLAADPSAYLDAEFGNKSTATVNEKVAKQTLKYVRLHKEIITDLFEECDGVTVTEFLDTSSEYFTDLPTDDVLEGELAILSEILPIAFDDVFDDLVQVEEEEFTGFGEDIEEEEIEEETKSYVFSVPEADENLDEDTDSDEAEITEESTETAIEQMESVDEPEEIVEEDETLDEVEEDAYVETEEVNEDVETEESAEEPQTEPQIEEEPVSDEKSQEQTEEDPTEPLEEEDSLNEKYEQRSTLNDSFGGGESPTLADKLEKRKVTSIMEAISVNHRYMFTKELFDGDREAFVAAVQELESCESFDDAVEMLVQTYAQKRSWDMNSDEVKELLKVVFRKYR